MIHLGRVDMAPVKGSRKVCLTNLVEFSLRLDNFVDELDDVIYFQNVLDRDFVKKLLRKLSRHDITVKILKDINLMEEKWRTEERKEWSILKMEGRPPVEETRVCFHHVL